MLKDLLDIELLDILSLNSTTPRAAFSKKEIDDLANNFLQVGGNAKPILVKQINFDNFGVLEGDLEYHAAMRAREIKDDFELIRCVVLNQSNESLVRKQYSTRNEPISETESAKNTSGEFSISTLEKNLLAHLQDTLKFEVSRLESNLSSSLEQKFDGVKILVPREEDHLELFNSAELKTLIEKLKSAGFTGKRGENMAVAVVRERQSGEFTSFTEVTNRVRLENKNKTRAISTTSMITILDAWNRFIDTEQVKVT